MANFFYYSNDAGFNQMMQQNGNQVKATMTIDQLLNQELMPMAQKEGARLVNKYPMQQLAEADRRIDAMYYKATPEQDEQMDATMSAFARLGKECKELLTKFYFQKKSMREISAEDNLAEASARNKKYRCIQQLKDLALSPN